MKQDTGKRVVAFIIDSIIVGVFASLLNTMYGAFSGFPNGFWIGFELGTDDWWTIIVFIGYYVAFAVAKEGQTFGKLALNLVVRYDDQRPMEQNNLVIREVLKSILMPVSFISFLFVIIRDDNKSLHDLLMNTSVFLQEGTVEPPSYSQPREQKQPQDDFYE